MAGVRTPCRSNSVPPLTNLVTAAACRDSICVAIRPHGPWCLSLVASLQHLPAVFRDFIPLPTGSQAQRQKSNDHRCLALQLGRPQPVRRQRRNQQQADERRGHQAAENDHRHGTFNFVSRLV